MKYSRVALSLLCTVAVGLVLAAKPANGSKIVAADIGPVPAAELSAGCKAGEIEKNCEWSENYSNYNSESCIGGFCAIKQLGLCEVDNPQEDCGDYLNEECREYREEDYGEYYSYGYDEEEEEEADTEDESSEAVEEYVYEENYNDDESNQDECYGDEYYDEYEGENYDEYGYGGYYSPYDEHQEDAEPAEEFVADDESAVDEGEDYLADDYFDKHYRNYYEEDPEVDAESDGTVADAIMEEEENAGESDEYYTDGYYDDYYDDQYDEEYYEDEYWSYDGESENFEPAMDADSEVDEEEYVADEEQYYDDEYDMDAYSEGYYEDGYYEDGYEGEYYKGEYHDGEYYEDRSDEEVSVERQTDDAAETVAEAETAVAPEADVTDEEYNAEEEEYYDDEYYDYYGEYYEDEYTSYEDETEGVESTDEPKNAASTDEPENAASTDEPENAASTDEPVEVEEETPQGSGVDEYDDEYYERYGEYYEDEYYGEYKAYYEECCGDYYDPEYDMTAEEDEASLPVEPPAAPPVAESGYYEDSYIAAYGNGLQEADLPPELEPESQDDLDQLYRFYMPIPELNEDEYVQYWDEECDDRYEYEPAEFFELEVLQPPVEISWDQLIDQAERINADGMVLTLVVPYFGRSFDRLEESIYHLSARLRQFDWTKLAAWVSEYRSATHARGETGRY